MSESKAQRRAEETANFHGDFVPADDKFIKAQQRPDATKEKKASDQEYRASRKLPVLITLDGRRINERFIIKKAKNIVGRDINVDIPISDSEVSRRHFYIIWENFNDNRHGFPICKVGELGSTNGTQVNGQELDGEKLITDGDLIRVGQTMLGFFIKDERVLQLDQLLLQMALLDSLTGLHVREFLFTELHREFQRARRHDRPLAVGMIDIDYFKNINDQYGHTAGDEVLRQMGDILRDAIREGDICGRYGGEEFAVVFPETTAKGAVLAAERIRKAVEQHDFEIGVGKSLKLSVSIGLACLGHYHTDKANLLEEADRGLYRAKQQGRNRVVLQFIDEVSTDNTIIK
jgi:two-component system, cell cycle response regulator